MSELLQNWLNNEVGLSTNVSNFEKDFSSGYLFGEILHKFWQADFEQFQNKNSHQAKIANFKTLEPILKALGIKFNATLINAVMNGERGAALRLLYQLKMASERSERPALALQASALEMQASVGWPGASMKVRQARVEKLTRKFEIEKQKQEIVAFEMDNIEQAHVEEQRQIHRFSLRERLRQNRAAKDEWEARGHELWQKNMKVRLAREAEEMRFSEKVFRAQQQKEQQLRRDAAKEVLKGTEDFESGLVNLGLSKTDLEGLPDSSEEEDNESAERLLAQTSKVASAKELVEVLQSKLPSNQELNYEAGLFMRKIKESKEAGAIARRERERRRRRVLVEQQREQEMLEENQLEQVLMEKLSRESIEESAISYRSWRAKTYEEVFVRNRQARQQQYSAKKRSDKEEALKQDQDLRDEMIETLREQEERERVRYRAVERLRHARRREKLREEMEGILELVVQMAFADLQQEQLTDEVEVDPTLWREWVALFQENLPVVPLPSLALCADEPAPLTAQPEPTGLANLHAVGAALNASALRDFMEVKGQWREEAEEAEPIAFDCEAEVKTTLEEAQAVTLPARAFSVIILLAQKQNPNGEMESETSEEGEAELLAPILAVLLVLTSLLSGAWQQLNHCGMMMRVLPGGLSLCFTVAFSSFWRQADGLIGVDGIFPISKKGLPLLQSLQKAAGSQGLARRCLLELIQSILEFAQQDPGSRLCLPGLLASLGSAVLAVSGEFVEVQFLLMILQCLLYRSLFYASCDFMTLQWDALLVEMGFWCAWLALHPWALLALRLLALKLYLQSAVCKLLSEDPIWRRLDALDYHFQTQPLPTPLGSALHHFLRCCPCLSKVACALVIALEALVPLLSFGERYCCLCAFSLSAFLMASIALTGNYGFFNLASTVLAIAFLGSDDVLLWPFGLSDTGHSRGSVGIVTVKNLTVEDLPPGNISAALLNTTRHLMEVKDTPLWALVCQITTVSSVALLTLLYAVETTLLLTESFSRATEVYSKPWMRALGGLGVSQSYGLFGSVEKVRRELVIRELREGQWREIHWRYKVGHLNAPLYFSLHMPRLDWLLWLAAIRIGCDKSLQLQRDLRLRPIAAAPEWLNLFLAKLAEQRQAVLSLLNEDFAEPPEALRMELCEYELMGCDSSDSEAEEDVWAVGKRWRRRKLLDVV